MLSAVRTSFTATLDAGADEALTRWMGALVLVVGAALTGVLLAIVPPTAEGDWGWIVAAVVITMRLTTAVGLASGRGPVRYGVIYAISALSIAGQCLLQYLAAEQAYFHDLVLIDLLYVAAVHTPKRTAAAVALAVAGFLPGALTSDLTPTSVSIAEWAAEAVLWALVAGLVVLYTGTMRRQRAELRRTGARAEALARVDALTGLGNRRAFDECFERELSVARRYGTRLSVLIGDLDDFKLVNDAHGHPAGDELLRAVAHLLLETVRRPDACFRWGGDEFAVILPRTGLGEAELVAARIRAALSGEVHDPGGTPAAISLGVAELGTEQEPHDLLATADAALLAAKSARPARARRRFGRRATHGQAHR